MQSLNPDTAHCEEPTKSAATSYVQPSEKNSVPSGRTSKYRTGYSNSQTSTTIKETSADEHPQPEKKKQKLFSLNTITEGDAGSDTHEAAKLPTYAGPGNDKSSNKWTWTQKLEVYDYIEYQKNKDKTHKISNLLETTSLSKTHYYYIKNNEENIRRVIKMSPSVGGSAVTFPWAQYIAIEEAAAKKESNGTTEEEAASKRAEEEVASKQAEEAATSKKAEEEAAERMKHKAEEAEYNLIREKAKKDHEDECKKNSELVWKAIKDRNFDRFSLILDLTNGEGMFTSHSTLRQEYPNRVVVDKYKNNKLQHNKYPDVLSYESDKFTKYLGTNAVIILIYDPPYQTIVGGHTLTNSNWQKSAGRIAFNERYGVEFQYTHSMIHAFYLEGFRMADKLLHTKGIFLVKLMHKNGNDQLKSAVLQMADICGYIEDRDPYKLTNKDKDRSPSYLYIFKKASKNNISFRRRYLEEDSSTNEKLIKNNIMKKAAQEYLEGRKRHMNNACVWKAYCDKLVDALEDNHVKAAFVDISEAIINSYKQYKDKVEENKKAIRDWESKNSPTDWQTLQNLCLEIKSDFTNIKLVAELLFEQLLLRNNIDVARGDEHEKHQLEVKTLKIQKGRSVMVNGSHTYLSANIGILRRICKKAKSVDSMADLMRKYLRNKK